MMRWLGWLAPLAALLAWALPREVAAAVLPSIEMRAPTILMSHAGFAPSGVKEATAWHPGTPAGGTFTVRRAGAPAGAPPVAEGSLRPLPAPPWHFTGGPDGTYWLAAFDTVETSGEYVLAVRWDDGRQAQSDPFEVRPQLYGTLAQMASRWFYYQRCGIAIPGFHAADHLDDGALRDLDPASATWGQSVGHRALAGGWHDAGDYNKWLGYGWSGIYSLVELWETLRPAWRALGEALPDPLAEAAWEVELYLRAQNMDGTMPYSVEGWHPNADRTNNPWGHWGPPERETDNRSGTADDRLVRLEWPNAEDAARQHAWIAAALARFAVAVEPFDPDLAARAGEAAGRIVRLYGTRHFRPGDLDALGGLTAAYSALAHLAADSDVAAAHRAQADRWAGALHRLAETGFWDENTDLHWPWRGALGALAYVAAFPGSELAARLRGDLAEFADSLAGRAGALQAYGVLGTPHSWQGYNPYFAGTAYLLALAGRTLDRPDLFAAAERQLFWILGRNPARLSMLVGVGTNPGVYHTRYVTLPGHADGIVPGGVLNGLLPTGDVGDVAAASGHTAAVNALDPDYPILAVKGVLGDTAWWRTNEYWIPNNAWFILAAAALQAGLEPASAGAFDADVDVITWSERVMGKE
ncbi:MAG TPA: glycoside hydrolase family 9 protein [Limnochordia bacterium]